MKMINDLERVLRREEALQCLEDVHVAMVFRGLPGNEAGVAGMTWMLTITDTKSQRPVLSLELDLVQFSALLGGKATVEGKARLVKSPHFGKKQLVGILNWPLGPISNGEAWELEMDRVEQALEPGWLLDREPFCASHRVGYPLSAYQFRIRKWVDMPPADQADPPAPK
jgi:hypothetical protein